MPVHGWAFRRQRNRRNDSESPAIVNALHDAIGVWITDLPITPEKVLRALDAKEAAPKR